MGKLMLYYLRDAIILSMIYHRQVTWVDLRLDPSHLFSKCLILPSYLVAHPT